MKWFFRENFWQFGGKFDLKRGRGSSGLLKINFWVFRKIEDVRILLKKKSKIINNVQ